MTGQEKAIARAVAAALEQARKRLGPAEWRLANKEAELLRRLMGREDLLDGPPRWPRPSGVSPADPVGEAPGAGPEPRALPAP